MELNVDKLKLEINQLSKTINNYEITYLNLYNELSGCSFYWQDENSKKFFENISKEKIEIKNTINELNDINSIYSYIIEKYNTIGNKIYYDLNKRNEIITKIYNCINMTHNIYNYYNSLDLSFCPLEAKYLNNELKKINEIEKDLNVLKNKIKKHFNSIEEIEKEVNLKITRLTIKAMKENNINIFI